MEAKFQSALKFEQRSNSEKKSKSPSLWKFEHLSATTCEPAHKLHVSYPPAGKMYPKHLLLDSFHAPIPSQSMC